MKHKVTYLLLALLASVSLRAQNNTLCPAATNMGTDFWVAFIYNYHETQSYNPGQLSITCVGNQNCTVSSVGPGSTCSLPLNAANSFCVTQPLGDNGNIPVGTVFNGGFMSPHPSLSGCTHATTSVVPKTLPPYCLRQLSAPHISYKTIPHGNMDHRCSSWPQKITLYSTSQSLATSKAPLLSQALPSHPL